MMKTKELNAKKYIGYAWYMIVEIALIVSALAFIFEEKLLEAFTVFILIELRDISITLKSKAE